MTRKKRTTLRELAESVGVHMSTVSRVLNPETRHLISEAVVEQVLRTARQLNVSPNRNAATLHTGRSRIIGVVQPDIANQVFPPILRGIEDELAKKGFVPLIANAEGGKERQLFVIDQMVERQVDGLILATSGRNDPILEHCLEMGIPVVVVNRSEYSGRASCVISDNQLAMLQAVTHLSELGHTCIAHVAGPSDLSTGYERHRSFLEAIRENGLTIAECPVFESKAFSRDEGRAACDMLLEPHPGITSIVAANDLLALGCYDAIRARGLRCPQDISIVGHNDIPLMDSVAPPMTTVRIPLYEMGVRAAILMLENLDGSTTAYVNVVLRPELVVRESTIAR
ncbi:LacI family DNA-binding transcriptional regulator [Paraburkholderia elongata]|uniref:Substrate-binding domain-containing protein n=1 Tax=Paraburkholderia elongata TaxID=2675747 RepID=A0A972NW79_9BURK|nr:LacI family DNA-binding transcriptional regulator [Paraburkholderia elongata]NPT59754.1 substrate-binding domain-containing protein [Paraburkholderia elongata]